MQFQRKTRASSLSSVGKVFIKLLIIFVIFIIGIFLINKIDFPSPNKKIEKILPNENFKIIK